MRLVSSHLSRPYSIASKLLHIRCYATPANPAEENIKVGHARFIAEAKRDQKWHNERGVQDGTSVDARDIGPNRGKLSPTSSHLFKLILPLPEKPFAPLSESSPASRTFTHASYPPTVFLLHPSQPLSHVSRLISASLPESPLDVSFRSPLNKASRYAENTLPQGGGRGDPLVAHHVPDDGGGVQWSDSTDIGDFIKEAAQNTEFLVVLKPPRKSRSSSSNDASTAGEDKEALTIHVTVPTFADRTQFLSARHRTISHELDEMESLRRKCDREAHKGARKIALGGFGALVAYWGSVARLTFWDVGWEVMEPVTYLSGLSTVVLGYLWFLYQGREVSYSTVLSTSISSRRQALYNKEGLDLARWADLSSEKKALEKEIRKIAGDYGITWKEGSMREDEVEKEDNPDEHLGDSKGNVKQDKSDGTAKGTKQ